MLIDNISLKKNNEFFNYDNSGFVMTTVKASLSICEYVFSNLLHCVRKFLIPTQNYRYNRAQEKRRSDGRLSAYFVAVWSS